MFETPVLRITSFTTVHVAQRALQHHAVGTDRGDDVIHVGEGADHRRIVDRAGQVEEYEVERGLPP